MRHIFLFLVSFVPFALLYPAMQEAGGLTQEENADFAWFDTLGLPDVKDAKYVHVATGRWIQRGDHPPENQYVHAFLLEDKNGVFRVLAPDLEVWTFMTTGSGLQEHLRVGYEEADLEKTVQKHLDDLIVLSKSDERVSWRRFGERLAERAELFALARGCARQGKERLAHDLLGFARTLPDQQTGKPPEKGFRQAVADEIANAQMWQAILDFGDLKIPRKELLATFRQFLQHFPESPHAQWARETAELLEKMVAEDGEWEKRPRKKPEEMGVGERVADLIFQLRDQHGSQRSQPGSCDIFEDERGEKSPAHQLVKMGYDAFPLLIEAIDDVRFTRSVGYHRNFYFSHHVLRVGDCALAILERIANRSFYEFTYTNAAMVKDQGAPTTKEKLKAWWAEFQNKGEQKVLVEATEAGDASQAARLCEKYPDVALAAVTKGLEKVKSSWDRAALVEVVVVLKQKEATDLLLRELREGTSLRSRVTAAGLVFRRGRQEGVPAMIAEWKKLKPTNQDDDDEESYEGLVAFLAGCGQIEATRALGAELARRPANQKVAALSAFDDGRGFLNVISSGPGCSLKPGNPDSAKDPEVLAAIEEVLVTALDDTEEREGMSGTWDGKSFYDPRICDIAGHVLSIRFIGKYIFDLSAFLPDRDRQRVECKNVWRKARGLPLLPLPEPRKVKRLPDAETRPLLDRVAGAEGAGLKEAMAALEAKGLGALSAIVERMEGPPANDATRARLLEVASKLACTVDEVSMDKGATDPDIAALEGKPLTTSSLFAALLKLSKKLPEGSRGFRFSADRDGDLTGVRVKIQYIAKVVRQDGSKKGWNSDGSGERVMIGRKSIFHTLGGYSSYSSPLEEENYEDLLEAAGKAFAAPPREPLQIRIPLVQREDEE